MSTTTTDVVRFAKDRARSCLLCSERVHCTNLFCYDHHASYCTPGKGPNADGHNVKPDALVRAAWQSMADALEDGRATMFGARRGEG